MDEEIQRRGLEDQVLDRQAHIVKGMAVGIPVAGEGAPGHREHQHGRSPGPGLVPFGEAAHQALVILWTVPGADDEVPRLLIEAGWGPARRLEELWSVSGSTMRPEKASGLHRRFSSSWMGWALTAGFSIALLLSFHLASAARPSRYEPSPVR